jgi:hypothetical protein
VSSPVWRAERVETLFNQINLIVSLHAYRHTNEVYPHIKHLVDELWEITQEQKRNHELDHKHIGMK